MLIIATDVQPGMVYTFEAVQNLPPIPEAEINSDVLLRALRSGDFVQAGRTIVGSVRQHPEMNTIEPTCLVVNITPTGIGFMPFSIQVQGEQKTEGQWEPTRILH